MAGARGKPSTEISGQITSEVTVQLKTKSNHTPKTKIARRPNETDLPPSQTKEGTHPNEKFAADQWKQLSELEQLIDIGSASRESEEGKDPNTTENPAQRNNVRISPTETPSRTIMGRRVAN